MASFKTSFSENQNHSFVGRMLGWCTGQLTRTIFDRKFSKFSNVSRSNFLEKIPFKI